jgi:proline iminopeptidase
MVYFDPRGMGESSPIIQDSDMGLAAVRADFDALRRHLGLEKVNALGWSNGAGNLMILAAEHPETIDAAIFLHGTASFSEEDVAELVAAHPEMMQEWQKYLEMIAKPEIPDADKTAAMRELWLDRWFPVSSADPDAARALLQEAFRNAELNWAHAAYANQETPTFDVRDKLPSITARSLVIHGNHDTIPMAKAGELHSGLPNSKLVFFESSGHFSPLEQPEQFKAAVFDFVAAE